MARTVVDRNEEGKREAAEEAAALAELQTALMELVAGQVRELGTALLAGVVASGRQDSGGGAGVAPSGSGTGAGCRSFGLRAAT